MKKRLKDSEHARSILDELCKNQEHQIAMHKSDKAQIDLAEQKKINQIMINRFAEIEKQNEF